MNIDEVVISKLRYRLRGLIVVTFLFFYLLFTICLGLALFLIRFENQKDDTSFLTAFGFAILATTTNICFSWARTTNQNSNLFKTIRYAGEIGFISTILFLLASIAKYFTIA